MTNYEQVNSPENKELRKQQIIKSVNTLMKAERDSRGHRQHEGSIPAFDIEAYPELLDKLAQIGPHFEDSLYIAQMILALWTKIEENFKLDEKDRSQLMICALLHDIGKSGPLHAKAQLREVITKIFATPSKRISLKVADGSGSHDKTVSEFLTEINLPDKEKAVAMLKKELDVDAQQELIIDFWRRHVDWTFDILRDYEGDIRNFINPTVVNISASHHILDGKNPAKLKDSQIPSEARILEIAEKYEVLTMVDKYQAFIERSGLSHEQAIEALQALVKENKSLPITARAIYFKVIEILDASKSELSGLTRQS